MDVMKNNIAIMGEILSSLGHKPCNSRCMCQRNNILGSMEAFRAIFIEEDEKGVSSNGVYQLSEKVYKELSSAKPIKGGRYKLHGKMYYLIAAGVFKRSNGDRKNCTYIRIIDLSCGDNAEKAKENIQRMWENGITPFFMSFERLCKIDVGWAEAVYGKTLDGKKTRRFLRNLSEAFLSLGEDKQYELLSLYFPSLSESWCGISRRKEKS